MELRRLGDSGISVSAVGLGCNNFGGRLDLERTSAVVDAAIDAGVTFFDTADIYGNRGGSERFLGELLEGRRDRVVLATKVGMAKGEGAELRGGRDYVLRAAEASLKRLRTDHVDLLYYHRPDDVTPLGETIDALEELVRAGKARAIACSNLDAAQLREAGSRIAALQNEYSLLVRGDDAEVIPLCRELGVSYIPYFPLASGLLTGKHRRGEIQAGTRLQGREVDDATFDRVEALERFAAERGRSLLELAISALASHPAIPSVIAGATTPDQVRANAAAGSWRLSDEELRALASLSAEGPREAGLIA